MLRLLTLLALLSSAADAGRGLLVEYSYQAGGGLPSRSVSLRVGVDNKVKHTTVQRAGKPQPKVRRSALSKAQRAELDGLLAALAGKSGDVTAPEEKDSVDGGSHELRYRWKDGLARLSWRAAPEAGPVRALLDFLRKLEPVELGGLRP